MEEEDGAGGEKQGRGSTMKTGQRRGDRDTQKSVKFGLRWWSWKQQLVETREVAPWSWGGD